MRVCHSTTLAKVYTNWFILPQNTLELHLLWVVSLLDTERLDELAVEYFGPLAQLVERYIRIVEVVGSTPIRSTR